MNTTINNSPGFTAHVPNTLGKAACDKLAYKLLSSKEDASIKFADKYFTSLQKIEQEKNIQEVIIRTTDKLHVPDVWCDGVSIYDLGIGVKSPKSTDFKEQKTFDLMRYINKIANDLPKIIKNINNRG